MVAGIVELAPAEVGAAAAFSSFVTVALVAASRSVRSLTSTVGSSSLSSWSGEYSPASVGDVALDSASITRSINEVFPVVSFPHIAIVVGISTDARSSPKCSATVISCLPSILSILLTGDESPESVCAYSFAAYTSPSSTSSILSPNVPCVYYFRTVFVYCECYCHCAPISCVPEGRCSRENTGCLAEIPVQSRPSMRCESWIFLNRFFG